MRVFVALFAGSIGGVLLFIGKIHYLFLIGIGMSAFGLCMYAWKKPWFLSKIRFKHTQPKTAPLIVRIESGRSVSMLEQTAAFKPSTLMVCLYFLLACVAGYIRCALCGYSEQDIGFFIQRKCFATIHGQIVNTPQQYSLPYGPDALRFQVAVDTIVLHYTTRKVSGLVEVMMPVPSFFYAERIEL